MKKTVLLVLIALPAYAWCQALPNNIRAQFTMDRLMSNGISTRSNDLVGLAAPPGRVLGDTYLDSKWNVGSVLIKGKENMIEGYPMKYDIKAQNVEIKTTLGVRLLDVKNVGHMFWVDSLTQQPHYFVNAANYKFNGVPMIGLMEVLADGKVSLLRKSIIAVKQPTYNAALDVGTRDTKILKKAVFYYNQGDAVVEVKSKKKLLESFGEYGDEVAAHMKLNRLDTKSARDLTEIFTFYNSKLPATN